MKPEVIGNVTTVCQYLTAQEIAFTAQIVGSRFEIMIEHRSMAKGSGIGGDNRWFWTDTLQTAKWSEITIKPARS